MLKEKIKALFTITGNTQQGYANHKKVSRQQISNKINAGAFRLNEAIELGDFTGTRLAYIDENNKPIIIFDKSDIELK